MAVADAIAGIRPHLGVERLVLVGHQPDLGELICYLSGWKADEVEVGKGSLWELELAELGAGKAKIRYSLSAKEVSRVREKAGDAE
jgi:phosphohistidine phosphatase SixA